MLFVAACLQKKLNLLLSRNPVRVREDYSLEQVGIGIFAPHESNSLDVNTARHTRISRKFEENTLCGVRSSCNVQK